MLLKYTTVLYEEQNMLEEKPKEIKKEVTFRGFR